MPAEWVVSRALLSRPAHALDPVPPDGVTRDRHACLIDALERRGAAARVARLGEAASPRAILAPAHQDPALRRLVRQLREAGEVVVQALPGEEEQAGDFVFDREIAQQNGNWSVVARTASPAK